MQSYWFRVKGKPCPYEPSYFSDNMKLMMFHWVWAPCGLPGRCQRFGEAYCLHLQGWSDHAGNIGWQEGKSEGNGLSGRCEVEIESPRPMGPGNDWLRLSYPPPPHWRLLGVTSLAPLQSLPHSVMIGPSFRLPFPPSYIIPLFLAWSLQPWRWRQYASSKRWLLPDSPHGAQTQKNIINIVTAVKTSNLKQYESWNRVLSFDFPVPVCRISDAIGFTQGEYRFLRRKMAGVSVACYLNWKYLGTIISGTHYLINTL
jgi:hypothetical protein